MRRFVHVGDDILSETEAIAWRVHETNVTTGLRQANPNAKVGKQITIDVMGPNN